MIKPPALKMGDRVALVCPGSRPAGPHIFRRCLNVVEEMGFQPVPGQHVMSMHGSMAGTDSQRLGDLHNALVDESIKGIFCLTGGYGAIHLLPCLDWQLFARAPKMVMGCQDNTHLLNAITVKTGLVTVHGPNLDQIDSRATFQRVLGAVSSTNIPEPVHANREGPDHLGGSHPLAPVGGVARGRTVGGNLTALVSLLGTPFAPDFRQALIVVEDRNERADLLERWFTSLYLSGALERASGVVFGEFVNCDMRGRYSMLSAEELLEDRLVSLGRTGCFGFPFGQGEFTAPFALGIEATLDADAGRVEFHEPAFV